MTLPKPRDRVDIERVFVLAKELRAFAVRSRMRPEEFFSACLINAAAHVKPRYERKVLKVFRELIREVRKDMREAKAWEVQDEAFGREFG